MTRWRTKFLEKPPQFVRGSHLHPFAGVVACAGCRALLVRNGKNGYRCRNDRRGCSLKFTVTEKLAQLAIEAVVPHAIRERGEIETVIEAASAQRDLAAIESRLAELDDRRRCLAESCTSQTTTVPRWVVEEEQVLADEHSRLQAQSEQARRAIGLTEAIIAQAPQLTSDPGAGFRQLGRDQQEFLVRALFRRIELEGTGHGNGRKVRAVQWELNGSQPGSHRGGLD